MKSLIMVIGLAAFSLLLGGCGGAERPKFPVAKVVGTVRFDGQPLEKGRVQFVPGNSTPGSPVAADVFAGQFEISDVPIGKHKVIFVATKETGKMIADRSEPYPEVVNVIPEKYRDGLDADVSGSESKHDFDLKSM